MSVKVEHMEPSGTVRGNATATVSVKGKQKRIAHVFLPTGAKVDSVTVEVPRTLKIQELRAVAAALLEFADAVEAA